MSNLSVEEFRHKILLKLYFRKLSARALRDGAVQEELVSNTAFAANELLRDTGFDDVWARKRGSRIFLFYEPLHRIICEVGIDATKDNKGLYHAPNIQLVNLHGIVPNSKTLQGIIDDTAKLGMRRKFNRKES